MKKNIILIFLLITVKNFAQNTPFENGYNAGFKKGYCYSYPVSCVVTPIPPLAPFPSINESSESFNDGYNKGFVIGKNTFDYENMMQSGKSNMYYNYREPRKVIESNGYIRPLNLQLLADVLAYKQNLQDSRGDWIQEQIHSLSDLNYCFFSRNNSSAYVSIKNQIQSLCNEMNSGPIDLSNNNIFSQIANYISEIRTNIFRAK